MTDDVAGPDGSALSEWLGPRCRSETGDVMLCANAACGWLGRCVAAEPIEPGEERDCQHGQLARACDRCADAREIAELRAALLDARDCRLCRNFTTRSEALAAAGFTRRPSLKAMEMRAALELIATPQRPDGTWNRDREACRELAAEALGRYDDSKTPNIRVQGRPA